MRPAASACAFPLYPVTPEGKCGCGDPTCKQAGKHPACNWGELGRGEKLEIPEGYGVGWATGSRSGFVVVDADTEEAIGFLAERLPRTFTVATSKGFHFYFKAPDRPVKNSASKIFPGVDVRGEGGYVVAPGSRHVSGLRYAVERDLPLASVPSWLLEHPDFFRTEHEPSAPVPVGEVAIPNVERVIETLKAAWPERGRHVAQLALAGALLRDGYRPGDVVAVLVAIAGDLPKRNSTVGDTLRKMDLGLPFTGWTELEGVIGEEPVRQARRILGGTEKAEAVISRMVEASHRPETVDTPPRKKASPTHRYTFTPGDVPNGDKKRTTLANFASILATHPDWEGVLQWDAFADRLVAVDPPCRLDAETAGGLTDADSGAIAAWGEVQHSVLVPKTTAYDAAVLVAKRNIFHPVKEYLEALPPSDLDLSTVAEQALGTSDPFAGIAVFRFFLGAVRRVLEPGTKVDTTLVLVGKQGAGKSSLVRALFHPWVAEDMADLRSKDAMSDIRGVWGVEIAELDKALRVDEETVKAFLTRCVDRYRPPYERVSFYQPRSCVFVGTTNGDEWLRDVTGSRRYWPVRVDGIDIAWLEANRDRIWAAAYALVRQGVQHWLTEEEEKLREEVSADYHERDPWADHVEEYLKGKALVSLRQVMTEAIHAFDSSSLAKTGQRDARRLANVLQRLGCEPYKDRNGKRWWRVPEAIATAPPPKATHVKIPITN